MDRADIRRLPEKPKIDEANYGWTGKFNDQPCLIIGHNQLNWNPELKTSVIDTRNWLKGDFSAPQLRRSKRFHDLAADQQDVGILVYVFEDVGGGTTSKGEYQAKRGRKRLTGWFEIVEVGEEDGRGWMRAVMRARD
ncbi:hypothetical protein [Hasllibacter halocynthiae]|uniref:hypothetical protein n=1 Tax=Hasllibacter halocynthiae TaxID=595589 RepID=UPI0011B21F55|nr:hypothetical protein [Hasllibacter halocynthiae]